MLKEGYYAEFRDDMHIGLSLAKALCYGIWDEKPNMAHLQEAKEQGVHGKETTPFLLARVVELTGGESLESNIQLVLNNARLAARTAAKLAK